MTLKNSRAEQNFGENFSSSHAFLTFCRESRKIKVEFKKFLFLIADKHISMLPV
jgi:hypothetical protein